MVEIIRIFQRNNITDCAVIAENITRIDFTLKNNHVKG